MKVLAIVPSVYDTSPGQRYRIEQWEPILASSGIEITYAPFETERLNQILYKPGNILSKVKAVGEGIGLRRGHLDDLSSFDLVYVFREAALLGPPWFERKIARSGVPMIFDFDDAVFVKYKSPSNGYLSYLKFPGKTGKICQLSAHVMAGNQFLADYASRFNRNVTIVPTTIDTDAYTIEERPVSEHVTIGWSGSFSTAQHLDTVRDTLRDLAPERDFKLRVIGVPTYSIENLDVESMAWKSETEVADLRPIDIGIMPLPDDVWSKGKCGLKALQYMALGIPTICSPVGVNSKIIKDGHNGFLAADRKEWIEKLKLLIDSPELRKKIGLEGRRTVEQEYSAKVQAPRVSEVFQKAAKRLV